MKKVVSWLIFLLEGIFLLFLCVLIIGYIATQLREQKTLEEVASGAVHLVKTRDARIFVLDEGPRQGDVVVLIHGTGARSELWRGTIDLLAKAGFRVLALDMSPFGFSEKLSGAASYETEKQAARILDVMKALHIEKADIVCHSVGCRAGVEAILESPESFEKAILVDAALGFGPDKKDPHFKQNDPNILLRALFAPTPFRDAVFGVYGTGPWSIKPLLKSFVYDTESVTDDRVTMLQQPLSIHDMTEAEGDWFQNLLVEHDNALYTNFTNFKKLTLPVLLVWGREDSITPLWQGEALQALFSHAQLSVIENAGHIPYIENVTEFNNRLLGFVEKTP